MSSFTAHIDDLYDLVPHRPPMVWIDEIVEFTATSGECRVVIKNGELYMGPEGLRTSSCLEFIAQAYGLCSMGYKRAKNPAARPLKRAFLASFKDVRLDFARLAAVRAGDVITVKYWGVRQIGAITMFNGNAVHNGDILCDAGLKVFSEE